MTTGIKHHLTDAQSSKQLDHEAAGSGIGIVDELVDDEIAVRPDAQRRRVNEEDLQRYKGKLKGKFVLFSLPSPVRPSFKPDAWRHADSALEDMAQAKASAAYRGRRFNAARRVRPGYRESQFET